MNRPKGITPTMRFKASSFGARESWVYEWVIYRRKMCEWTWDAIGRELEVSSATATKIYLEAMGDDAYTGPLPEWSG